MAFPRGTKPAKSLRRPFCPVAGSGHGFMLWKLMLPGRAALQLTTHILPAGACRCRLRHLKISFSISVLSSRATTKLFSWC